MTALTLTLLGACQWFAPSMPAPNPGQPVSTFHEQGGGASIRLLDRLAEAEVQLPPTNRPEGSEGLGVIELKDWRPAEADDLADWVIPSPVALPSRKNRTPPSGLALMHGADRVSYHCPTRSRGLRWCAQDGELFLSSEVDPATMSPPLVLVAAGALSRVDRVDVASAGRAPVDYLPYEHEIRQGDARITRPGMLLPAPGSVTWTLTLPEGARLDLSTAMVDLGLADGPRSDGARLIVEVDGDRVGAELVRSADRFDLHRFDLSAWGGREVRLTLRSDPLSHPDWDYVFVGEPTVSAPPGRPPRRVVVIGIDTLRWTNLSQHGWERDTSAALDALASSSALFDDAYTPAPRTRPSFRTAVTGRRPIAAMDAPTIGEVFREHGFVTAGVTANVHLVPRFGFNDGFDLWHYENAADAEVEIARAKGWLRQVEDRDALLFLHLMDPHTFYAAPWPYEDRFVTVEPSEVEWFDNRWKINAIARRLSKEDKLWLHQRYDGEVNYMADELARFVAWLTQLPGETLIVVHNDHGEEFFEHQGYEHNHTLYQEVVKAVLWVRPPGGWGGGPHHLTDKVALMDIAPTLYDFAGIPRERWPEVDGVSLRPLLDAGQADLAPALREALAERPLPIGHLMYDVERWAVVSRGHKYILRTMSGQEELYDLRADPGEQADLAPSAGREVLDAFLADLGRATGWPTGPGLRVQVKARGEGFTMRFDRPVQAMVLDPEAGEPRRANIEWGEIAQYTPEDVGVVQVSEDGLSLTFTPGSHGQGTLAVVTGARDASWTIESGGEVHTREQGQGAVKLGTLRLDVEEGPVILQQDSVRQRLADDAEGEDDAESLEALRALGYIE